MKGSFENSAYLKDHPAEAAYRLEHSYRVANIAKAIAGAEGLDVTCAVIAGLLHDVAYCKEMTDREAWKAHGRRSAAIARPFLESLGLPETAVNDICYGIAIHVDDEADFEWNRTAFCDTVGDADNIDRFDVYRIYESLQYLKFSEQSFEEKTQTVESTIRKLTGYLDMKLATASATKLWKQRIEYYIGFYQKLRSQLHNSQNIL